MVPLLNVCPPARQAAKCAPTGPLDAQDRPLERIGEHRQIGGGDDRADGLSIGDDGRLEFGHRRHAAVDVLEGVAAEFVAARDQRRQIVARHDVAGQARAIQQLAGHEVGAASAVLLEDWPGGRQRGAWEIVEGEGDERLRAR